MSKKTTSYRFEEFRDDDYGIVVGWQRIRITTEVMEFIHRPDPEMAAEFDAAREADPRYSDEADPRYSDEADREHQRRNVLRRLEVTS